MTLGWSLQLVLGEPNAGSALRTAMAVMAFVPGGDAPGDVDEEITLTLLSIRPMMFQDSEVEMQDRVGALEMAVDDAELTMAYRRNVPRYCGISSFARILTCSVGRSTYTRGAHDGAASARCGVRAGKAPTRKQSPTVKRGRVFPQLPLGGDDDRLRDGLERTGGGGEHLGAGRRCRACSMTRTVLHNDF